MNRYLTYDDVNIIPKYSDVTSRDNVTLNTKFTKKTELQIPIVSSPMDTITEYDMAFEMMIMGGVGVIHRFNSIEEQSSIMNKLHTEKYDHCELPLCAAVGIKGDYLERTQELVNNGCNVILIDVAHGHHKLVGDAINEIKKNISGVEVIPGNNATGEGAEILCKQGADGIRAGIGNGSLCETRIRTGVGVPSVSSLLDVVSVADRHNVPVIADGGVRNIGDVCKGLGCGADSVMLGRLISGTKETPGSIEKIGEWPNEQLFKKYRGSASLDSKKVRGENKNVEGNHKVIPYKGKLKRILQDITEGIKSSFSYVGASNFDEFHSRVEFVEVTYAGMVEARPHLL